MHIYWGVYKGKKEVQQMKSFASHNNNNKKKICRLFFSQSEVHISKDLTWDNVEDRVGPHGPHWLHSQCWAGLQRCRGWWKKTAVSSSPLPEDRSKWLPQCLHIWEGVSWEIKTKGRGWTKKSTWTWREEKSTCTSAELTKHKQDSEDSSE